MDFDKLARKAQQIYNKRGGAEAARGDAVEVEWILAGQGTLMDKAKAAAKAFKQPGAQKDRSAPARRLRLARLHAALKDASHRPTFGDLGSLAQP